MKGIYILLISITRDISVSVGALGNKDFHKGLYAYVGSAQNNLEKRVERHLRRSKESFGTSTICSAIVKRKFSKHSGRKLEDMKNAESPTDWARWRLR